MLALYTSRNGWFLRKEDDLGSLEVGQAGRPRRPEQGLLQRPGPGAEADPVGADGRRREDRPRRRLDQRLTRAGPALSGGPRPAPARAARGAAAPPRRAAGSSSTGSPICDECGRGVAPTGPDQWRHVRPGRRACCGRSQLALPHARRSSARCGTYAELRGDVSVGGAARGRRARASTEGQWREAVARLERYEEALRGAAERRARSSAGENPYPEWSSSSPRNRRARGPARRAGRGAAAALLGPAVTGSRSCSTCRSASARARRTCFAWAIPTEAALDGARPARAAPRVRRGDRLLGGAAPSARRRRDRVRPGAARRRRGDATATARLT